MAVYPKFSREQVAGHGHLQSLYLVISGGVYDCTEFSTEHPGGPDALLGFAGKDATEAFEDIGHSDQARLVMKGLQVGVTEVPVANESYSTQSNYHRTGKSVDSWLMPALLAICGTIALGSFLLPCMAY